MHTLSESRTCPVGTVQVLNGVALETGRAAIAGIKALARRMASLRGEWGALVKALPERLLAAGYAPSTATRYADCVGTFLTWCHRRGRDIPGPGDTTDFLAWLDSCGQGTAVRRLHLSAIRTSLDRLAGWSATKGIAYAHRPLPTPPAEASVICRLVDTASERDATLVLLLAQAGLRPGEVAALRWEDVARDGRTVRVYRHRPKRAVRLAVPSDITRRMVALRSSVPDARGWVFPGRTSRGSLSVRGVQAVVARLTQSVGLVTSCTALCAAATADAVTAGRRGIALDVGCLKRGCRRPDRLPGRGPPPARLRPA